MTDIFLIAHDITQDDEGFYSNDKDDPGAETVYGLTKAAEPKSPVWPIVEGWRKLPNFPENMRHDLALIKAVADTYRSSYWEALGLHDATSELVAVKLFNSGVNVGIGTVRTYLKLILNSFNKKEALWPDMKVNSGSDANLAIAMMKMIAQPGGEDVLYSALDSWQGVYYHVGKKAFQALVSALELIGPQDWRETFEWGWWRNRILTAEALRFKIKQSKQKLGL